MPLHSQFVTWLHRHPGFYKTARSLWEACNSRLPPVRVNELPGRIHRNDCMALDRAAYIKSSFQHMQVFSELIAKGGKPWGNVNSVMDFGCGYGRIIRWFPVMLPPERIYACDVNGRAVAWCSSEFGVTGVNLTSEFTVPDAPPVEALLACSLLTHLSPRKVKQFLKALRMLLAPGGVAVVTGKSTSSAAHASQTNPHLDTATIRGVLEKEGIYFMSYPHMPDPDLGDTYFEPEWLRTHLPEDLELIETRPGSFWSQDAYLLRKNA